MRLYYLLLDPPHVPGCLHAQTAPGMPLWRRVPVRGSTAIDFRCRDCSHRNGDIAMLLRTSTYFGRTVPIRRRCFFLPDLRPANGLWRGELAGRYARQTDRSDRTLEIRLDVGGQLCACRLPMEFALTQRLVKFDPVVCGDPASRQGGYGRSPNESYPDGIQALSSKCAKS